MPTQFPVSGNAVSGNPSANTVDPALTYKGLKLGSLSSPDQISAAGCCCEPPGPGSCRVKICPLLCDGSGPFPCEVRITVKGRPSGQIFADTTLDDGKCLEVCLRGGLAYDVSIIPTPENYATVNFPITVSCTKCPLPIDCTCLPSDNIFNVRMQAKVSGASALGQCCDGSIIPNNLVLTDSNGTWPFTHVFQSFPVTNDFWCTCYTIQKASTWLLFKDGGREACGFGGLPPQSPHEGVGVEFTYVSYVARCVNNKFTVTRGWLEYIGIAGIEWHYVPTRPPNNPDPYPCPQIQPGVFCGAAGNCLSLGQESAQVHNGNATGIVENIDPCEHFVVSVNLTDSPVNHLPGPATGPVAISQM